MKNKIITTLFATFILLGMTSCRKCEICTQNSEPEVRVCEGDYNNNTEYGLALDVLEFQGYKCR